MPSFLALVQIKDNSGLPENYLVNTLAFDDAGALADPDNLANDLAVVYQNFWNLKMSANFTEVEVRFYDHADLTPRPVKGQATAALTGTAGAQMPREVALCLSFYADRNLPRNRGRIYIGGFSNNHLEEKPSSSLMQEVLDLGGAFAGLGGLDVDWAVYSRTDNVFRHITDTWVDDSWDTVRSRGLAPDTRLTATVQGE